MKKHLRSLRSRVHRTHIIAAAVVVVFAGGLFAFHANPTFALRSQQRQINLDGGSDYTYYPHVPVKQLPTEVVPPSTPPNTTTDVQTQYVNSSGTVTGYRSWNTQVSGTLWYAWNRGYGGTLFPSNDSAINGYVAALSSPNITIGYDYGVYDADHPDTQIPEGSTIPAGKKVILKFAPYTSDNIFWFGTGYSMDSPYGEWRANAAAPSRVGSQVTCESKDLTAQYTAVGNEYDVYIPFVVNPPSRSLANISGLTCGSLTTNSDGSQSATCTATGTGDINPTFDYASTYGKFYYRYHDNRNMTSIGWGGPGCYGNNIPLTLGATATGPSSNSVTTIQPAYSVNVPAQSFAYPLKIAASTNKTPSKPTMSCSSAVKVGQDLTATLSSTDPDGDQVQYGVDWIDDGTQGVNSGWTSLVNSGTSQTLTKTGGYSTPGTYTIYGWARDKNEAQSDAASCTVTVSNADAPDLTAGTVSPTAAVAGAPVTLAAKITNGGTAATGGSFTDLFQISDSSTGFGALSIGTYANAALAVGSNSTATLRYTFDSAGTYYVRACADKAGLGDKGVITESNEGNNCGTWAAVTVSSVAPTCTLSASPSTKVPSTLSWSCTNATTCTGGGFSTGNVMSGTKSVSAAGNYSLSCTGPGGSDSDSVSLAAPCTNPVATITADKTRVQQGDSVNLSYHATGIDDSCTISGPGVSKSVNAASCTVSPATIPTPGITTQSTYTITCGAATDSVIINVIPDFSEF
jgi:hypothetical protein